MARVVLIHWKPKQAAAPAAALRKRGHRVSVLAPRGMPELRALGRLPPDAVVVDLGRLPSQGGAVAVALRQQKATRGVPLVFVEGDPEKTARVHALLPDAVYTTWSGLPQTLDRALRGLVTPAGAKPVVPGTMAGYSGTPLPKKLGIKPGSRVALLGAPPGFEKTLGAVPGGASVRTDGRVPFDVGLLFVRSQADLASRFSAAVVAMGEKAALWIVWPKRASGVASDLGGNEVRAFGLARGLVDYKVVAVDETWSGLCFARRKAR
jgi:CheY-like chemotaxis protein